MQILIMQILDNAPSSCIYFIRKAYLLSHYLFNLFDSRTSYRSTLRQNSNVFRVFLDILISTRSCELKDLIKAKFRDEFSRKSFCGKSSCFAEVYTCGHLTRPFIKFKIRTRFIVGSVQFRLNLCYNCSSS